MVKIQAWKWGRDPHKYILALEGETLFEDAPRFLAQWCLAHTFEFKSALARPIPKNSVLVLARRAQFFPYNTLELTIIDDVFNPAGRGVFFLADRAELEQLARLTNLPIQ